MLSNVTTISIILLSLGDNKGIYLNPIIVTLNPKP